MPKGIPMGSRCIGCGVCSKPSYRTGRCPTLWRRRFYDAVRTGAPELRYSVGAEAAVMAQRGTGYRPGNGRIYKVSRMRRSFWSGRSKCSAWICTMRPPLTDGRRNRHGLAVWPQRL